MPIEFAKGYTKGVSDQVKRTYWAHQEAQRTADEDLQGRIRYYNATIPERQDSNGVIRVQREVIIPIVPDYVNMLGLDDLFEEVNKVKTGVGKTVADFTETANGIAALEYTGQGLYQDLSELPDKFGQKVEYQTGNFKKFGVVQDMNDDYNTQLSAVNQSFKRLEDEVLNTTHQIDSAGSLVETEKLKAKLQAVQGTLETNMHRASLAALKVLVQGELNRNDQGRAQEASRQRRIQEMAAENQELQDLGGELLGPPTGR